MHYTDKHIFARGGGAHRVIHHADGIYCYDVEGKRYIDGRGGALVVNIGHGVKEIFDAAVNQMQLVCFSHSFHWTNIPHMQLAQKISEMAPRGMSKVFMVSGGSEATESALKLARKYHVERGKPSKYKVISRWNSYHGNTLGALSMTGMFSRRKDYLPLLSDFPHIPPCNCYHCPFEKEYPACGILCAKELEKAIQREGADSIAGFIAEPIVGNTAGAVTPPPEYFPIVRKICDRYDVLLIADEIITGFGRTGKNFAVDHWGVIPDIICTGKGMGSGYSPLGALIIHDKISQVFDQTSKTFDNGFTYAGNPLTCAIGIAVLDYMERNELIRNVETLSPYFFKKAEELSSLEIVGEVRGKGFLMGIEFVKDKTTREPFPPEDRVGPKIAEIAFSKGLATSGMQGCIDGIRGDYISLGPPFICTSSDLDAIIEITKDSIVEFQNSLKREG